MVRKFSKRVPAIVLLVVFLQSGLSLLFVRNVAGENTPAKAPRHLIVCVDGVGFTTIEKMRAEGHFRSFGKPSRMISPFPTLTNVSMTEILQSSGAVEAPGYEDNYFDVDKNKMRGGLLDRFNNDRFINGTFRELFDYHPSAIKSGLGYALPPLSTYLEALSDLVRLKQKFRKSDQPVYFAYTGATDSLAHLGGERLVRSFMSQLDDILSDIMRDGEGSVQVTIFSDHGNEYRKYKRVSLKSALRRGGFRLEGRVKDDLSVVLPQFGLIGCGLLFTNEKNEQRLAEISATVRGVNFAAYDKEGVVWIVAREGLASIERRGDRFRYRAVKGDPLKLSEVMRGFSASGKSDGEGFIADADWFEATKAAEYPDAIRRVYEGVTDHVRNRANVILNFEDGYYSGSFALDIFAFLQATHGNLMRGQSYGFVISTKQALPDYVRAEGVWAAIGAPTLNHLASKE